MWSFETDPEFQASLDWIDEFTKNEIEPLDLVFREPGDPWDPNSPAFAAADGRGLQGLATQLHTRCQWVVRHRGERYPK